MAWEPVRNPQGGQPEYAAGFVLAGGQSSRMGTDKTLLSFHGETLLERAVGKLREVCPVVSIAGGNPKLAAYAPVVADGVPGQGPLGGLVAALEQTSAEWNLFIAVDMPVLPVSALRALIVASGGEALVTLARAEQYVQPLCGVYSRRSLPVLRAELAKGNRRVRAAVEATGSFAYWQAPELAWFTNVNTPDEFAAAEKLVGL